MALLAHRIPIMLGLELDGRGNCQESRQITGTLPFVIVAQKSPCEGNRVIMGKESPLKLSQRGQDARQEVPMRTPKRLYAEERIIYHPELLTCLHCGDLLVMCNYLAWDKTVQTLDRLLSVARRPGRCPHATCPGSRMRLLSAEAQRLAPPGSTYGYDVLVRIGWLAAAPARHLSRDSHRSGLPGLASPSPMCAICISTSICPCWPATSVSSATAWPRSPRSKAA